MIYWDAYESGFRRIEKGDGVVFFKKNLWSFHSLLRPLAAVAMCSVVVSRPILFGSGGRMLNQHHQPDIVC